MRWPMRSPARGRRKRSPATPCARRSPISSCCPTCMRRPTTAGAPRRALPCARSPTPIVPRRARMRVELTVNGEARTVAVEPRTSLLDCLRDELLLTGANAGCEHGVCGACTVLVDGAPVRSCLMFCRAGRRIRDHHHRGTGAGAGRALAHPGRVLRDPWHAMRLLHPGDDPHRPCAAGGQPRPHARGQSSMPFPPISAAATGYAQIVEAIALAAERMRSLNRPASSP